MCIDRKEGYTLYFGLSEDEDIEIENGKTLVVAIEGETIETFALESGDRIRVRQ